MSMLPSQMRDAMSTAALDDLIAEIQKYPDYFMVWRSPDDDGGGDGGDGGSKVLCIALKD